MVRKPCVKGIPGCGCNGKCGERLSGQNACCCTHICEAICVRIEPADGCPEESDGCECTEPVAVYVLYDSETESFHGSIGCGGTSFNFDISISFNTETESCEACLTATCVELDEDDCKDVASQTAVCTGEKDENGDWIGGMDFSWVLSVENCGGPTYCTNSYELIVHCMERIDVESIAVDENGCECTGCKCLCKELCVTYTYDDGELSYSAQTRLLFDHGTGSWYAEWLVYQDALYPEGISIVLEITPHKNEYTGECELLLTVDYEAETIPLTNCPFLDVSVELTNATLEIKCYECQGCEPYKCTCNCRELPDSLTASWSYFGSDPGLETYPPFIFGARCDPPEESFSVSTKTPTIASEQDPSIERDKCDYAARNVFCATTIGYTLGDALIFNPFIHNETGEGGVQIECPDDFQTVSAEVETLSFSCDPVEASFKIITDSPCLGSNQGNGGVFDAVIITISE